MSVVRLRAPGGPEQPALEEADRPRPGPVEAQIAVPPSRRPLGADGRVSMSGIGTTIAGIAIPDSALVREATDS